MIVSRWSLASATWLISVQPAAEAQTGDMDVLPAAGHLSLWAGKASGQRQAPLEHDDQWHVSLGDIRNHCAGEPRGSRTPTCQPTTGASHDASARRRPLTVSDPIRTWPVESVGTGTVAVTS